MRALVEWRRRSPHAGPPRSRCGGRRADRQPGRRARVRVQPSRRSQFGAARATRRPRRAAADRRCSRRWARASSRAARCRPWARSSVALRRSCSASTKVDLDARQPAGIPTAPWRSPAGRRRRSGPKHREALGRRRATRPARWPANRRATRSRPIGRRTVTAALRRGRRGPPGPVVRQELGRPRCRGHLRP